MIIIVAFAVWAAIALTPLGSVLEASLTGHVLIEIPILVATGALVGVAVRTRLSSILSVGNAGGIPGILLASFTLAFWMIPRWLDAAINDDAIATIKYLSLPVMGGLPLALSWQRLHPIARGVVKIEFLAMIFRLGWIYIISPNRLCNNYLFDEQERLGHALILAGAAVGLIWAAQVLFGSARISANQP